MISSQLVYIQQLVLNQVEVGTGPSSKWCAHASTRDLPNKKKVNTVRPQYRSYFSRVCHFFIYFQFLLHHVRISCLVELQQVCQYINTNVLKNIFSNINRRIRSINRPLSGVPMLQIDATIFLCMGKVVGAEKLS